MNRITNYIGAVMQAEDGILYEYSNGVLAGSGIGSQSLRVVLTGYTVVSSRGTTGYQTSSGYYIVMSDGWEQVGTAPVAQYSETQAQALVNKIIKNNKLILSNNLLCARFANKLTYEQQAAVRGLQSRLNARNAALQADGLTKDIQTSYPAGYAELSAYMDALMSGEAVGIATWAVIVIAAVVIAGMGTAAYFAYKNYADESEKDVKYSKELTQILTSKLTEEEYQQLLSETKGIVTKARIKQALGTSWSWLRYGALAVAVVAGYKLIKSKK